jgi:hypothetical protein
MGWYGAARLNNVNFPECRLCEDTSNIDVSTGSTPTIDGVVSANGNIVLLLAQTTPAQNGPWTVNATGAWTRPSWFATGYVFANGEGVIVQVGDVYADSLFATNTTGTVGTNDPLFQNTGMSKTWITSQLALKVAKAGDTMTGALVLDRSTDGVPLDIQVNNPLVAAPMTVNSAIKVDNLNADLLDGVNSDGFVAVGGDTMTGPLVLDNAADGAPLAINVNNPLVAAPMTVDSAVVVTNLNADKLDGQHGAYYAVATALANYLPLAGGTATGDITISKSLPIFKLTNTAADPDNSIGLKIIGDDTMLFATTTMATNYGNYVDFAVVATQFATTAAIPSVGTKFAILARQYLNAWDIKSPLTIAKDVGSSNFIPHGGCFTNVGVYMSRWTGAARETVSTAAYTVPTTAGWHTVGYYFDDDAGKAYCSVDGQPWIEASTAATGLWTSPWSAEMLGVHTFNGTSVSSGSSTDPGYAQLLVISGMPTDADAAWFYNGGAGQDNAKILTRFSASKQMYYAMDESGVVTTMADTAGGSYTLTADGDVEGKLYPSSDVHEVYPYYIEPSSVIGVLGILHDASDYCQHIIQGRQVEISPFDESLAVRGLVAKFIHSGGVGCMGFFSATPVCQFSAISSLASIAWTSFTVSTHTLTQAISVINGQAKSQVAAAIALSEARINSLIADLKNRGDMAT